MSGWPSHWELILHACAVRGATGRWGEGEHLPLRIEVALPATESQVTAIERRLGCSIPTSLRRVFLEFSAAVTLGWQLPDSEIKGIPAPLKGIFAGECRWNLTALPELQTTYRGWLEIFTDPDDKYDGPWQGKFPLMDIGNGDMLSIDPRQADGQPVVYLSHEGDDSLHGYWLGRDFEDYIDRLNRLGCVGSEDWQLTPFVSGPHSLLDPDGTKAKLWRDWLGLRDLS